MSRLSIVNSLITIVVIGASSISSNARADTHIEKKIIQFGGPEIRLVSIGDIKTKGAPNCHFTWRHGLSCSDTWIVIKGGQKKVEFKQHLCFLVVSGPAVPTALQHTLDNAVQHGLEVAAATAAATPGDPTIKVVASVEAFKVAFVVDLGSEPLLSAAKEQFKISVRADSTWE